MPTSTEMTQEDRIRRLEALAFVLLGQTLELDEETEKRLRAAFGLSRAAAEFAGASHERVVRESIPELGLGPSGLRSRGHRRRDLDEDAMFAPLPEGPADDAPVLQAELRRGLRKVWERVEALRLSAATHDDDLFALLRMMSARPGLDHEPFRRVLSGTVGVPSGDDEDAAHLAHVVDEMLRGYGLESRPPNGIVRNLAHVDYKTAGPLRRTDVASLLDRVRREVGAAFAAPLPGDPASDDALTAFRRTVVEVERCVVLVETFFVTSRGPDDVVGPVIGLLTPPQLACLAAEPEAVRAPRDFFLAIGRVGPSSVG